MIVATATDRNYVELTAVMLASLVANARDDVSRLYVFCDGLNARDKALLRDSCDGAALDFVDLTDDDMSGFATYAVKRYLSRTSYVRLLIPDRIDERAGRLLYVDCDTIINGALAPLEEIDLEGYAIGAVEDDGRYRGVQVSRNLRLGLPPEMKYLNAGVLLIDLHAWHEQHIAERVRAFCAVSGDLPSMDQDALNGTLRGEWLSLDGSWNAHGSPETKTDLGQWTSARIIHFVGRHKPHFSDCTHPARGIFLEHRSRTPWARRRLKSKIERNVGKIARQLGRLVKLP